MTSGCEEIVVSFEDPLPPIIVDISVEETVIKAEFSDELPPVIVEVTDNELPPMEVVISDDLPPIVVEFSEVGLVGPTGPAGATGATGPTGPPGSGGGGADDFYYEHIQAVPSAGWTVIHNLGRDPNVSVIIDDELAGVVAQYVDPNTIYIPLSSPRTGKVVCS